MKDEPCLARRHRGGVPLAYNGNSVTLNKDADVICRDCYKSIVKYVSEMNSEVGE